MVSCKLMADGVNYPFHMMLTGGGGVVTCRKWRVTRKMMKFPDMTTNIHTATAENLKGRQRQGNVDRVNIIKIREARGHIKKNDAA
jgi:hypothetical protein